MPLAETPLEYAAIFPSKVRLMRASAIILLQLLPVHKTNTFFAIVNSYESDLKTFRKTKAAHTAPKIVATI